MQMSSVKWTDSQRDAISARGGSVLVSAAAGSGKTAVLVQRVIDTITDKTNPTSIDRMLIVTFTRAAREEMLTRVEKAINNLLKDDPRNQYLLHQKQLLYSAKITTIDGFCTDFVRQYFYKLDIQQDFRIADEKEVKLLISKALDNTLERYYNSNSQDFLNLVSSVCNYRSDDRLRENIEKLYKFLVTIPFMDSWLDSKAEIYNVKTTPVKTAPYIMSIFDYAKECLKYCFVLSSHATGLLCDCAESFGKHYQKFEDCLVDDNKIICKLIQSVKNKDWDSLFCDLSNINWSRFPGVKNMPLEKDTIKAYRDNYKAEITSLSKLVTSNLENIEEETKKLYPIIKTFFDCVKSFYQEFETLKAEQNLADFADIENWMIKLLCKETDNGIEYTDLAYEIANEFDYIMVDEFQDINSVQDLIFRAISKDESNLFMVGDVKQSIYGFRQANPEIFTSYKNRYPLYNSEADNYPAKIILDKNFRSRNTVLNACNFVFANLMSTEVGGIEYNQEEVLNCGATYPDTKNADFELMLFTTPKSDNEDDETKVELEAKSVAKKIMHLIYEEKFIVTDKDGSQRPVQFSDIAILLRTAKGKGNKAAVYVNVLEQCGIPATASEKTSIFDAQEIKVLVNLLKVIDNPLNDIPLLSVLMSPIGGFTADDIALIRSKDRYIPLYKSLLNNKDNPKFNNFLDLLTKLRYVSVTNTVDKLISIILQMTGYDSIVMAMTQKPAKNIYLFREYARTYGENGYRNLSSFVRFIDKLQENDMTLNASDNAEDIVNAVQVMSIHSSKGLEFPVCFICDTSTAFNTKDISESVVIHPTEGVGIKYKDEFLKYDTVQRKSVGLTLKDSMISEELRILYVAMTRAKEKLIVTVGHQDPYAYIAKVESKLTSSKLSSFVVKSFNSFSDWLVACALIHPSGREWRDECGSSLSPRRTADLLPWKLSVDFDYGVDEIQETPEESTTPKPVEADTEFLSKFKSNINFNYKNQHLITLPQKVAASELAHKDSAVFNKVLRKPQFESSSKVTGTDVGTAFHSFVQHCDFELAKSDVVGEIKRLTDSGFITLQQSTLLDVDKISDFLNSSLLSRVIKSDQYFREYRFMVKISAKDYDNSLDEANKILMQGAVDLAFVEDNELVLVDYKTDRVKDINSLKEIYSKQLELYKFAMEQSTDKIVKEMYIYSVHLNEYISIS